MQSIKKYDFYYNELLFSIELTKDEQGEGFGYRIYKEDGELIREKTGFSSEKETERKAENLITLNQE